MRRSRSRPGRARRWTGDPAPHLRHVRVDGRLSSLVIQPKDQALFDRAVDSFLRPEILYGETG
jgi:hypothetical protein